MHDAKLWRFYWKKNTIAFAHFWHYCYWLLLRAPLNNWYWYKNYYWYWLWISLLISSCIHPDNVKSPCNYYENVVFAIRFKNNFLIGARLNNEPTPPEKTKRITMGLHNEILLVTILEQEEKSQSTVIGGCWMTMAGWWEIKITVR